jgi:pSer/pThr/pTyr-binding forkhead associated (FHA) protein
MIHYRLLSARLSFMSQEQLGELVPIGGGDAIPLIQDVMTIGRRKSCDIQLDFANISGTHAELAFRNGWWHLRDMGSTNGVKVNGERTLRRALRPGDEIAIANHKYTIQYHQAAGSSLEDIFSEEEDVFGQSLMEKAGLEKPKRPDTHGKQ